MFAAMRGWPARTAAVMWVGFASGSVALADTPVRTLGHMVTTGGTLDFGDEPKPPRRARPARSAEPATGGDVDWLYSFIDMLLDNRPAGAGQAPAPRPKTLARPRPGPGTGPGSAPGTTPGKAPASAVTGLPGVPPGPSVAPPVPTPPVVITGTIDRSRDAPAPSTLPSINQDDLDASVIGDAEIAQAREDLVKLELARRTYDEQRLSGQSAFDQRLDWRVLERGHDAWHASELAAAHAVGFEANTYINDTTRTIVVAIAGTQDLRRDFLAADIWQALIQAQSPQHFFLAKSYVRSVQARYQSAGYLTECVGHSLGGGACAYAASELGIRAIVLNPISAGQLGELARHYVTNYVVDGDIAAAVYALRGNALSGDVQRIRHDREQVRAQLRSRYGVLAGPIRVVRDLQNAVKVHQIERALDIIAGYAGTQRVK